MMTEGKNVPGEKRKRGYGRTLGKLCALLIAAMLAGELQTGLNMRTYAAEITDAGNQADPGEDVPGGGSLDEELPEKDGEEAKPTPTKKPGKTPTLVPTEDAGDKEDGDEPAPTKKPEKTLTPVPTGEAGDEGDGEEPTPTKKPKKTPTPVPTGEAGDEGDGEEPTPTKKPKKTPTPAPTGEAGDEGDGEEPTPTKKPKKTPTPAPTGEAGDEGSGDEPTPTKKPKKTLTPAPTGEAGDEGDGEEPTPTKKPKKTPTPVPTGEAGDEGNGDEPTPTLKPTKSPSWAVPTESDDARYQYLLGINAEVISIDSPPEGYKSAAQAAKNMKTIMIPVWKIAASGRRYTSSAQLTINKKLAKNVQKIFDEIYALEIHFPIKVIRGYMYRKVGGVGLSKSRIMSIHSFGAAIDINPGDYDNDYFLGKGNDLRDKTNPYCIPDEVIAIFEKYGWFWGGNFEICADTMHFQYFELGMLTYQGNSPFRTLKVKGGYMTGSDVRNLQQRLRELGFSVSVDGVYGSKTASAIEKYQRSRGLAVTGEVDYKTWETIINETHYMSYAF